MLTGRINVSPSVPARNTLWLRKTEDEARELVAIRIYLDELERDEGPVAESAVVNHYTVSD